MASTTTTDADCNVARRLTQHARATPREDAVVEQLRRHGYRSQTFKTLDEDSTLLASGLRRLGVQPGTRLALLVRPGIDFVTLVFSLFKVGAVTILIDPGMGRKNLLKCLADARPEGFVAIPMVQFVRRLLFRRFPRARFNITVYSHPTSVSMWRTALVGLRLAARPLWGGLSLDGLRQLGSADFEPFVAKADDPAAIIFTTGSTGPPKGVLYLHGGFDRQVTELRDFYGIAPGEIDLAGFPLFGLFNAAMGVTTVVPDMDPTRPAKVDPTKFVAAITERGVTQSFGSPAIWNRVGLHCEKRSIKLPTLRRVLSAGAPVPAHVLQRMKDCIAPDGDVHTPYGATEALPVASIAASEILAETAAQTALGAGVCVGRKFSCIRWRVIKIVDGPIAKLSDAVELPQGQIGELIVNGPVVTREYVTRLEANALGKIHDGDEVWHRMGDVGYFDDRERFWFCGRLAHRVRTSDETLFTIRCEAIFNTHPAIYRSALVGVGPLGQQRPVIIAEPWPDMRPEEDEEAAKLIDELRALGAANPLTRSIHDFMFHPSLPVDIRHNAKIFREKLAVWAAATLKGKELMSTPLSLSFIKSLGRKSGGGGGGGARDEEPPG